MSNRFKQSKSKTLQRSLISVLVSGAFLTLFESAQAQVTIEAGASVSGINNTLSWAQRAALNFGNITIDNISVSQGITGGGSGANTGYYGLMVGVNNITPAGQPRANLTIQNGGSLTVATASATNTTLSIGGAEPGYGFGSQAGKASVIVSGPGSILTVGNSTSTKATISLGSNSSSELKVFNGGRVEIISNSSGGIRINTLSQGAGNQGPTSVLLSDPGSAIITPLVSLGSSSGKGGMTISNEARLQTNQVNLSGSATGNVSLNIGGAVDEFGTPSAPLKPGYISSLNGGAGSVTQGSAGNAYINFNHNATEDAPYILDWIWGGSTNVTNKIRFYNGVTLVKFAGVSQFTGVTEIFNGASLYAKDNYAFPFNSLRTYQGGILDNKGFKQNLSNLYNAGTWVVRSSIAASLPLVVNGQLELTNTSLVNIVLGEPSSKGPFINLTQNTTSQPAQLAGKLQISGFSYTSLTQLPAKASLITPISYILIKSTVPMLGDFETSTIDTDNPSPFDLPDYLVSGGGLSTDSLSYILKTLDLNWNANRLNSSGTFTLNEGTAFDVDLVLANKTGSFKNWDGKSLIKAGPGILILSKVNTYDGDTTVNEGILKPTINRALFSSRLITINTSGTLDLQASNQATKNMTNNGTVLIQKTTGTALSVSGDFLQSDTGQLVIDVTGQTSGATLTTSGNLTLAGSLIVTGLNANNVSPVTSSSALSTPTEYLLLSRSGGANINGDFTRVSLSSIPSNITLPDYLIYSLEGLKKANNYVISTQTALTWTKNNQAYRGTFTLEDNATFTIDTQVLSNQTATSNWDGKSLIKQGLGTLIFKSKQSYTGTTTVMDGSIIAQASNVLSTESDYFINQVGTLTLDYGSQSIKSLMNQGKVQILTRDAATGLSVTDSVTNQGTLQIATASLSQPALDINGQFTQTSNGALNVSVSAEPLIIADTAVLDGRLILSGFTLNEADPLSIQKASELANSREYTLIRTQNGITVQGGDFVRNQVTTPDYLIGGSAFLSSDSKDYVLRSGFGLAWFATSNDKARGDFTLDNNTSFNVDVRLDDKTGAFTSGWNGKTLTKRGNGMLELSADNTYTGGTHILEGMLSIASGNSLGTGAIYLGSQGSDTVATLIFQASSGGAQKTTTGLNSGDTVTINNDVFLNQALDNHLQVSDANSIVTLAGSLNNTPSARALNVSPTGLIKTGAGRLIIDPATSHSVNYNGQIDVQQGALVFSGDGSQLNVYGDILVSDPNAQLIFDINNNTMRVDGTISSVSETTVIEKSGAGTLLLAKSSHTSWSVTNGSLYVSNSMFDSDITLTNNATLAFILDSQNTLTQSATYSGQLLGENGTTLEMNRAGGTLNFEYNTGSRLGNVSVLAGTLNLIQTTVPSPAPSNNVDRLLIHNNLNVASGATLAIVGSNTYLNIEGNANFKADSLFKVTLDAERPQVADVLTGAMNIENSQASIELRGFAVPVSYDMQTSEDFDKIFKASDLGGFNYLVIDSLSSINGEFSNALNGGVINSPSYLIASIIYQADSNTNASGASHSELVFSNFRLAWLDREAQNGILSYATGTFNMDSGTAFNIDVPLPNMPGTFLSGWDGKSLTKEGMGLLVLSNSDITYTGTTNIREGTLLTPIDHVLSNSSNILLGEAGHLELVNTTQQIKGLENQGVIDLGLNGHLILLNQDENGNPINSYSSGKILGGNTLHTESSISALTIQQGDLKLEANSTGNALIDIDHVILKSGASLSLAQGAHLISAVGGENASRMNILTGAQWTLVHSSIVDTLNIQAGANIDFGNPQKNLGQAGRILVAESWVGQGGLVTMYGRSDLNGKVINDQIIINTLSSGTTQLQLIDLGGVAENLASGGRVTMVKQGGEAHTGIDSFYGDFITGTKTYPLIRDPILGDFGYNLLINDSPGEEDPGEKDTPLYLHYDALLGSFIRGQTPIVKNLGDLGQLSYPSSCKTNHSFGQITATNGDKSYKNDQNEVSYRSVEALAGSSLYTRNIDDNCFSAGVFIAHSDTNNDFDLLYQKQGTHNVDNTQLGSFARYDFANSSYVTGALVYAWDKAKINDKQDPIDRYVRAQSIALSLESGVKIPLSPEWTLTPSFQMIYQHTSIDNVTTVLAHTEFDSSHTTYTRLGASLNKNISEYTNIRLAANLWHQFNTATSIATYGLDNRVYLNSLNSNESDTWAEIKVEAQAQLGNGFTGTTSLRYTGLGKNSNQGYTAKLGVQYRW